MERRIFVALPGVAALAASRAFGQTPDGAGKVDVLVLLDEGENVAAFMAAKTMENLFGRVDVEAGGFFFMERAEGNEIDPGTFEGDIAADDLDNIASGPNLLECGGRNDATHGKGVYFLCPRIMSISCSCCLA